MIRIREKDILFIAINLVMFLSVGAYVLMEQAISIGLLAISKPYPTIEEGMIYLLVSSSDICMKILGVIVLLIDIWWLYRQIRSIQRGYWKENL